MFEQSFSLQVSVLWMKIESVNVIEVHSKALQQKHALLNHGKRFLFPFPLMQPQLNGFVIKILNTIKNGLAKLPIICAEVLSILHRKANFFYSVCSLMIKLFGAYSL